MDATYRSEYLDGHIDEESLAGQGFGMDFNMTVEGEICVWPVMDGVLMEGVYAIDLFQLIDEEMKEGGHYDEADSEELYTLAGRLEAVVAKIRALARSIKSKPRYEDQT